MVPVALRPPFNILCVIDWSKSFQSIDKKNSFTFFYSYYTVYMYSCCVAVFVSGGKMQDYLLESLKLQRIDFFIKLVAASECSDEEKRLAIQWVSELTDELIAKIRNHEDS